MFILGNLKFRRLLLITGQECQPVQLYYEIHRMNPMIQFYVESNERHSQQNVVKRETI